MAKMRGIGLVTRAGASTSWLALAIVMLLTLPAQSAAAQADGEPKPVIAARAQTVDFVDRIEAIGTTVANETIQVTANVTEKVIELGFDDGQAVEAGAVLVVLDKDEEEANLKAVEALMDERQLAFDRARKLEKQQFTSTAQLDERRAALGEMEAQIEAVKARIRDRVIRAPFGGVVGIRNISVGALVEPGDVITTLDDLSVVKVDFSVPSTYLEALRPGLPVAARAEAFSSRKFKGEIKSVDSRVDPVTRSIVARAVLPNPDGTLKPGLLLTIELLKNPRRAIVIPEHALLPTGRLNFVLVVDEGGGNTVSRRQVEIGARRPGQVEILSGLAEGELVVTRGTLQVRPGQTVTVSSIETEGEPLDRLLDAGAETSQ